MKFATIAACIYIFMCVLFTFVYQLYWTNFGGRSKERLDAVMSYKNWDVSLKDTLPYCIH